MRSPLFFYLSCLLIATILHLKSRLDLVSDQAREAITYRNFWKSQHDELFRLSQAFDPHILNAIHLSWRAGFGYGRAIELGMDPPVSCSSNVVVGNYRAVLTGSAKEQP